MRIYDIIEKKKHGEALTEAEIRFFANGAASGKIPDYQLATLLMAICLKGMTEEETFFLTAAIAESGDQIDLSAFGETTADKHSSGGVGDKTTLILAPIAASCGVTMAKMSGRGLGHTGGTVDKLESIAGYRTTLSPEEFCAVVKENGIAVIGQSGNLAPADKKLYALRDVTATVDSIPLIASSIMGKKLAAGSKTIVLDVKYGSGGFMKTPEQATELAEIMVRIGKQYGRRVAALITNMDVPLGNAIGNALEIKEAIEVLRGGGCPALRALCLALAGTIVSLALGLSEEEAAARVTSALDSGTAFRTFCRWIGGQGGDVSLCEHPELLPLSPLSVDVFAERDGYVFAMDAERTGEACVLLGAGRQTKEDVLDLGAGIILHKKASDPVCKGDRIATLYASDKAKLENAKKHVENAITYADQPPKMQPLIYKKIL